MSPIDEAALNRWIARRDAEAFRALVQRHAGTVYATCRRIVGNIAAAEDITQECFETLARTKTTTQIRALGPWLHGVATKLCLVHIRSEGRRRQREANYVSEQDAQSEIQWIDIYDYIDEIIASLPDEVREPLIAHYFYGDSHADIARNTDIPRRTVSSRIQRGVESVGAALKAHGITVPSALLAGFFSSHLAKAAPLSQSLAATLGKIALTHASSAAVTTPMAALLSLKGAAVLIVSVVAVTTVGLILSPRPTPDVPANPSQQASSAAPPVVQIPPIQDEDASLTQPTRSVSAAATAPSVPVVAATAAGAVIEGRITFQGKPVPDQIVSGAPYRSAEPVFIATTDEQGYYRVDGLKPQQLTVRAGLWISKGRIISATERMKGEKFRADNSHSANEQVVLDAHQTLRVDFEFPRSKPGPPPNSGSIKGFVLVDGQVPEEAIVWCFTADNRLLRHVNVEPDGSYYLDSIPAGDHFVRLYVPRPRSEEMEWWTRTSILADRVTTFDINVDRSHTGTIRGDVRGLRDGEDANVVAFKGEAYIPNAYTPIWLSEVDAPVAARARYQRGLNGYLMEYLAPGTYTVVTVITSTFARGVPPYGVLDYRVIEIEEGSEATVDFAFTADDPPVLEGVLNGLHPEDNAWVNVYRGEFPMPVPFEDYSGPSEFMATQFHADRRRDIEIWNLGPGTYSLWASARPAGLVAGKKKTDWTIVTIPENQEKPIHVELTPVVQKYKATIHCRLLNLRPDRPEVLAYAIPGRQEVPLQATGTYWQRIHREARSSSGRALDSDALTLTGLDPGAYTVIAFHFPMRNTREVRDAAGISSADFYAATLITSAQVTVRADDEEIQLELTF